MNKNKISKPVSAALQMIKNYDLKSKDKIIYDSSEKNLKKIIENNALEGLAFLFAKRKTLQVSEGYYAILEDFYFKNAADTILMNLTLKRLSEIARDLNIEIVLFKGATLIKELLEEKSIRSFDDIDFLIDKKYLLKLHVLLKHQGYKTWLSLDEEDKENENFLNEKTIKALKKIKIFKPSLFSKIETISEITNHPNKELEEYCEKLLHKLNFDIQNVNYTQTNPFDKTSNINEILNNLEKQKIISEKQRENSFKKFAIQKRHVLRNMKLKKKKLKEILQLEHEKGPSDIKNRRKKGILQINFMNQSLLMDLAASQNKAIIEYDKKYFSKMKQTIQEINEYKNIKDVMKEGYHLTYRDMKTKIIIEPHFHIFERHYNFNFKNLEKKTYKKLRNIKNITYTNIVPIMAVHLFHHKMREPLRAILDLTILTRKTKINWDELIILSKNSNTSSLVYVLLSIGKELVDLKIPSETLKRLKEQSPGLEMKIIKSINFEKVISGKRDFYLDLHYKLYFNRGIISNITKFIHRNFV